MKQNLATYLTQVTIIDFKITIGGNVIVKQNKKKTLALLKVKTGFPNIVKYLVVNIKHRKLFW